MHVVHDKFLCHCFSYSKTKLLVAGAWNGDDLLPISIGGETIEAVNEFKYLGYIFEAHGEALKDVESKLPVHQEPLVHCADQSLKTRASH